MRAAITLIRPRMLPYVQVPRRCELRLRIRVPSSVMLVRLMGLVRMVLLGVGMMVLLLLIMRL